METMKTLQLHAQRIRALAQNGLLYSLSDYDTERYAELLNISDSITSLVSGVEMEEVQALYLRQKEYVTPKVDIRAVVFNSADEVLLVKEKADGLWSLPGGWADVGFTPSEVAEKEVKEETGLDVKSERLLAVMDMSRHRHPMIPFYVYKFFILCRIEGGEFSQTFDILDKGFFPVSQLPPLSEERVLPEQIGKMFELNKHPQQGVYLD